MFLQNKLATKKKEGKPGKIEDDGIVSAASSNVSSQEELRKPASVKFSYGPTAAIPDGAMIIVDPLSTGAFLAAEFHKRGIPVIRVMSR